MGSKFFFILGTAAAFMMAWNGNRVLMFAFIAATVVVTLFAFDNT
jgi:hypothetical protein